VGRCQSGNCGWHGAIKLDFQRLLPELEIYFLQKTIAFCQTYIKIVPTMGNISPWVAKGMDAVVVRTTQPGVSTGDADATKVSPSNILMEICTKIASAFRVVVLRILYSHIVEGSNPAIAFLFAWQAGAEELQKFRDAISAFAQKMDDSTGNKYYSKLIGSAATLFSHFQNTMRDYNSLDGMSFIADDENNVTMAAFDVARQKPVQDHVPPNLENAGVPGPAPAPDQPQKGEQIVQQPEVLQQVGARSVQANVSPSVIQADPSRDLPQNSVSPPAQSGIGGTSVAVEDLISFEGPAVVTGPDTESVAAVELLSADESTRKVQLNIINDALRSGKCTVELLGNGEGPSAARIENKAQNGIASEFNDRDNLAMLAPFMPDGSLGQLFTVTKYTNGVILGIFLDTSIQTYYTITPQKVDMPADQISKAVAEVLDRRPAGWRSKTFEISIQDVQCLVRGATLSAKQLPEAFHKAEIMYANGKFWLKV
jgi:hypothetical protein